LREYLIKILVEKAVEIAIREGKYYKSKLAGRMLLVIYRDRLDNELKYLEIEFLPHHFQHLTGLLLTTTDKTTGERIVRKHVAKEFYVRCVKKPYITPKEIEFENKGTIDLKMAALPYITQITKITKMAGEFDEDSKENLFCDYIVGGENSCIGISKNDSNDVYFPRSCLKENIKKVTLYTSQVIAIFQKNIHSKEKYADIKYVAKGINLLNINLSCAIKDKMSLEKYEPPENKDSE